MPIQNGCWWNRLSIIQKLNQLKLLVQEWSTSNSMVSTLLEYTTNFIGISNYCKWDNKDVAP